MPVTFPSHRVTFPSNGESYSPVRGSHIPSIRESHIPQFRIFTFLDQVTFPSQGKSHSVAKERESSDRRSFIPQSREVTLPSHWKSLTSQIKSHSPVRGSHVLWPRKVTLTVLRQRKLYSPVKGSHTSQSLEVTHKSEQVTFPCQRKPHSLVKRSQFPSQAKLTLH